MKQTLHDRSALRYDPLGLISPVVVQTKMLMQNLWLLDWDDEFCSRANGDNYFPASPHFALKDLSLLLAFTLQSYTDLRLLRCNR